MTETACDSSKKTIKVKYVDFWPGVDIKTLVFYDSFSKNFNAELSDDPDYLVYSVFGFEHFDKKYDSCIKIFYTGECVAPDFNICDYAVGFDDLSFGDRYIRMPIFYGYKQDLELAMHKHEDISDETLKKKDAFCSFVYSNANAKEKREEIFSKLSEYKTVDSGGKYLNNVGGPVADKIDFESHHKFSIACENADYPGYVTEKIIQSLAAKTVPVYWGDPCINKTINPDCMINVRDFDNPDDLLKFIIEVDNDDEKYLKYLKAPAFTDDHSAERAFSNFDKWIINIFSQDKEKAFRRNRGFWGKNNIIQNYSDLYLCNRTATAVRKAVRKILLSFIKK